MPLNAGWSTLNSLVASATGICATSAVDSDHAYCWRELFDAAASSLMNMSRPTSVELGLSWRTLSVGHYADFTTGMADTFTCGIQHDGTAGCWGSDFSGLGLLGAGTAQSSSIPLPLAAVGPWSSISAGHGFACGIKLEDASAWCW